MVSHEVIGRRVRAARNGKGLTLENVSSLTGLTVAQLSKIERGERTLRLNEAGVICPALGIGVSSLLVEFPAPLPAPPPPPLVWLDDADRVPELAS